MPPSIAFDSWARLLVVLHAAAAIVLIGASTHHAVVAVGYLRGRFAKRLARIYAGVSLAAYGVTMLLGMAAYPTFRYHTRALYLDRHAPWASNLFDMKENLAALGLPLVLAAFVLSRGWDPAAERGPLVPYVVLVLAFAALVWFAVFSGFVIVLERGIG